MEQNVLARYATVALASILDPSGGLFSDAARPCQRPAPVLCQNSAQPASTKELRLSKSGSNSSTRTGYTAGANI